MLITHCSRIEFVYTNLPMQICLSCDMLYPVWHSPAKYQSLLTYNYLCKCDISCVTCTNNIAESVYTYLPISTVNQTESQCDIPD